MSFFGGGAGPLGSGLIRIGADTSALRGQVRGAIAGIKQELTAGAAQISRQGTVWGSAFKVLGQAAKLGMVGAAVGLAAAAGAAISFESAFAGVKRTVQGTPAQLAQIRQGFRDLAKEIPTSANELAKIGETAGTLGIRTQDVVAFTKTVALLGVTTNVSTEQAATSLGQLSNVLGLTSKDFERFGSALVYLGINGASTESQILDIASRAGAAGKLIGFSAQQTLAWGSAVASLGIQVEAGGSALQNFYVKSSQIINEVKASITKTSKGGAVDAAKLAIAQARVRIATEALSAATKKHGATSLIAQRAQVSLMTAEAALNKVMAAGHAPAAKTSDKLAEMAKVAGMTDKAFKSLFGRDASGALVRFLAGLGKLPAAIQLSTLKDLGLNNIRIVRTLLGLANNTTLLNKALNDSNSAWAKGTTLQENAAKRFETTASKLAILKNRVIDLLIGLGDMLLPTINRVIDALANGIPAAARSLAAVWTNTLYPPIAALATSLTGLAATFLGIFSSGQKAASGGSAISTAFQGVANVMAQVSKMLTAVVDGANSVLRNPLVQWVVRLTAAFVAMRVAIGLGAAAVTGLRGLTGSAVRFATFGRLGTPAAGTPESKALDGSAAKLTGSAAALKEAAGAIKGGVLTAKRTATLQKSLNEATGGKPALLYGPGQGTLTGPPPARPKPSAQRAWWEESGSVPARMPAPGLTAPSMQYGIGKGSQFQVVPALKGLEDEYSKAFLTAVPLAQKEEYLKHKAAYDLAGRSGAQRAMYNVENALAAGVSGLGQVKSGIGRLLGGVGKLFWPAIVADLGAELLKAPLGDFIANNTSYKRAGAKIKEDFFGGIVDLFTLSLTGADEAIGHAETMTIGKAHFNTASLARLGITSATFDKLEAPEGTITNAQGKFEVAQNPALTTDLAQKAGESIRQWWDRVQARLPDEVRKDAAKYFTPGYRGTKIDEQGLAKYLATATAGQLGQLNSAAREAYLAALVPMLKEHGFTVGQVHDLSTAEMANIGNIMAHDTTGQYTAVVDYLLHSYLSDVSKKTPGQVGLSADLQQRVNALAATLGKDWQAIVAGLRFDSTGAAVGKLNPATAKRLQAALGKDWRAIVTQAATLGPSTLGAGVVRKLKAAFGANWKQVLNQAAGTFSVGGRTYVSAEVATKLKKLLGDDWANLVNGAVRALRPRPRGAVPGGLTAELHDLQAQEKRAEAAIEDFYKSVPQNVRDALDRFIADADTIDPAVVGRLKKRFGEDWKIAFRNGTDGIGSGRIDPGVAAKMKRALGANWKQILAAAAGTPPKELDPALIAKLRAAFGSNWLATFRQASTGAADQATVAEMVKIFGPDWRKALSTFGSLLFDREGGADGEALRKSLASAVSAEIAKLTPADLSKTTTKINPETGRPKTTTVTPSKADAEKQRAAIEKAITKALNDGTLAAATSTDATTSKANLAKLGSYLKAAIPDEASRNRFIGTLVALQNASKTPTLDDLTGALKSLTGDITGTPELVDRLSGAIGRLADSVRNFFNENPGRSKPPSGSGAGPQGRWAAQGMVFDTKGTTSLTVGEAGTEHIAVLRNIRRMRVPDLRSIAAAIAPPPPPAAPMAPRPTTRSLTPPLSRMGDVGAFLRGLKAATRPSIDTRVRLSDQRRGDHHQHINVDRLQLFSPGDERHALETLAFMQPAGV